jgi:hypothetical protein
MRDIYDSFEKDMNDTLKYISFIRKIDHISSSNFDSIKSSQQDLFNQLDELKASAKESNRSATKVPGILLLYVCGRFEFFVRELIEDLAVRIAANANKFDELPAKLQHALIKGTSQIMGNHGRYGKSPAERDLYIKNLAKNIGSNDLTVINKECVSITDSNMRPDVIKDLFSKVGISNLWESIGQQNSLKILFEETNSENVKRKSIRSIEEMMTTRNSVAHPSSSLSWPAAEKLEGDIEFLKTLAQIFIEIGELELMRLNQSK